MVEGDCPNVLFQRMQVEPGWSKRQRGGGRNRESFKS